MIPNWLLVTLSLTTLLIFVVDYAIQYVVPGHTPNSAFTALFGSVCGLAFALARGKSNKDKSSGGDGE